MIALAGYTGFVGSNIYARASNRIDGIFNTQNIEKAYGLEPDVLIFAGLKPDRRLAERAPYQHLEMVLAAQETIKKINPYKLVLISSTEVYKNPVGVDEENSVFAVGSDKVDKKEVLPYNLNRYYFEEWARKNYPNALILRLATPYGLNFKHNRIKEFADERRMQEIDSAATYLGGHSDGDCGAAHTCESYIRADNGRRAVSLSDWKRAFFEDGKRYHKEEAGNA